MKSTLTLQDFIGRLTPDEKLVTGIHNDGFYTIHKITSVETGKDKDWFYVGTNDYSFGIHNPKHLGLPFVGNYIRRYHQGESRFGASRGIALLGDSERITRIFNYMTPLEAAKKNFEEYRLNQQKTVNDFEDFQAEYRERIKALPEQFHKRFERLERNNPTFGQEFGSYELHCCEQAVKLVGQYPTVDELGGFINSSHEEQMKNFPDALDHSGNTWGFTTHLARLFLTNPELVEYDHGAMHGLTGCEEYGCYAAYKDGTMPIAVTS